MKNNRRRLLILIQRFGLAKTLQQGLKNINEISTLLITSPTEDEKTLLQHSTIMRHRFHFMMYTYNIFE